MVIFKIKSYVNHRWASWFSEMERKGSEKELASHSVHSLTL